MKLECLEYDPLEPLKPLEKSLTDYFKSFAREHNLLIIRNPEPPHKDPVFIREAYDFQTSKRLYLNYIDRGKAQEHCLEMKFGKPVVTEEIIDICESLKIDWIMINGRFYEKKEGMFVNKVFNSTKGLSEYHPLKDYEVSQIMFNSEDYCFEKIEKSFQYISNFLKTKKTLESCARYECPFDKSLLIRRSDDSYICGGCSAYFGNYEFKRFVLEPWHRERQSNLRSKGDYKSVL
ncbi:hypothetical protein HYX15_01630 [Candidatus Woesearchaeota archaeon]|nr:hypothetical protein [Candidatus Woesearchaeota archaeon]